MNKILIVLFSIIIVVLASSHSEAPGTAALPQADGTDLYVFRSYESNRQNFVSILANFLPLQSPFGGPNYFSLSDQHFYDISIDNTGDGVEDLTFRFTYGNRLGGPVSQATIETDDVCGNDPIVETGQLNTGIAINVGGRTVPIALKFAGPILAGPISQNLNWVEFYTVDLITGNKTTGQATRITQSGSTNTVFTKPFDNAGTKTFPNYAAYANQYIYEITIPNCATPGRVFVGQRKEPFQINLGPIFDLVNFVPIPGFPGFIGENPNNNNLKDKNVCTFALELPISCVTGTGNGVIGVWQSTLQLIHSGQQHIAGKQVQRMANPLVNEIFMGLRDKGKYNRGVPRNDANLVLPYIQYPTFPEILSGIFLSAVNQQNNLSLTTLAPNNYPRNDLVAIFQTGIGGINQLRNLTNADMVRLNTSTPVTPPSSQSSFGVIGGDNAGYPNGRRPGDDTIDIGLRALMGRLCVLPLGFCTPANAPIGAVNLTDGVPCSVFDYDLAFPYFKAPLPGSTGANAPALSPTPIIPALFSCPPSSGNNVWSFYVLCLTSFIAFIPIIIFVFA